MMDLQKIISELLAQLNGDAKLAEKFKKDPIGTVKSLVKLTGLTDDQLKTIADGVGAKLKLDDAKSALDMLGGLLGKK